MVAQLTAQFVIIPDIMEAVKSIQWQSTTKSQLTTTVVSGSDENMFIHIVFKICVNNICKKIES